MKIIEIKTVFLTLISTIIILLVAIISNSITIVILSLDLATLTVFRLTKNYTKIIQKVMQKLKGN